MKKDTIDSYLKNILDTDLVDFDCIKPADTHPNKWKAIARLKRAAGDPILGIGDTPNEALADLYRLVYIVSSRYMRWKDKVLITNGEIGDAIGEIETKKEAQKFLKLYKDCIGDNAIPNINFFLDRNFSDDRADDLRVLFGIKKEIKQ